MPYNLICQRLSRLKHVLKKRKKLSPLSPKHIVQHRTALTNTDPHGIELKLQRRSQNEKPNRSLSLLWPRPTMFHCHHLSTRIHRMIDHSSSEFVYPEKRWQEQTNMEQAPSNSIGPSCTLRGFQDMNASWIITDHNRGIQDQFHVVLRV